ncbi:MAG: DUF6101 family protein [Pseudomonadota bacterium]
MNAVGSPLPVISLPQESAMVSLEACAGLVAAAVNDAGSPRATGGPAVVLPVALTVPDLLTGPHKVTVMKDRIVMEPRLGSVSTVPVASYRGVAVSLAGGSGAPSFVLALHHDDPMLSVVLGLSADMAEVARLWQAWAKALGLPLLAIDQDGDVHVEMNALGVVLAERPSPRRRGSALVGRRSRFARQRRAAPLTQPVPAVGAPAAEREIIARN